MPRNNLRNREYWGNSRFEPREPHIFNPGDDFENWKSQMNIYLENCPDNFKTATILNYLSDPALKIFRSTEVPITAPPGIVWKELTSLFSPHSNIMAARSPTFPAMSDLPTKVKILETHGGIQERRKQALSKYSASKGATEYRRHKHEQAKRYQYFKRDADELESWIFEKLHTYSSEDFKELDNIQVKRREHQAFEVEVTSHAEMLASLYDLGDKMLQEKHYASEAIKSHLSELHKLWQELISMMRKKARLLDQTFKFVQFLRQIDEILFWIREKETYVTSGEYGNDLEHVEALQKKFDEFLKEMEFQEQRAQDIYIKEQELLDENFPGGELVSSKSREVRVALESLKTLTHHRRHKLFEAHEIQRFFRDTDRAISWVNEKSIPLTADDYGHDLTSIQALQLKHETLERDVSVFQEKLVQLGADAEDLSVKYPDSREGIHDKYQTLLRAWKKLKVHAGGRGKKLNDVFKLHRFLADWRDLSSWIADMRAVIETDELAKDVACVEVHIERHNEHEAEITSREESYITCVQEGRNLIDLGLAVGTDIATKLYELEREREGLLTLWESKRVQYEQCVDPLVFSRDAKQLESCMAKQEMLLDSKDVGYSADAAEVLLGKNENLKNSHLQQERVQDIEFAKAEIAEVSMTLTNRCNTLKVNSTDRRKQSDVSQRYQVFDRGANEMQSCIIEKLISSTEEINLRTQMKKLENSVNEVQANPLEQQLERPVSEERTVILPDVDTEDSVSSREGVV